jgi:DNA-binding FadR family transcriptional regulator
MKKSAAKKSARARPAPALRHSPANGPTLRANRPLTTEPFRSIHDYLSHKLGREIVSGQYRPGDQLPNEIDLRGQLSVSRAALREAYRVLTAKGLITSRQNVGTRVRPKSEWNMLDPEVLLWHLDAGPSEEFLVNLFDLRRIVEPAAAERAARVGAREAIAEIKTAFDDMARSKDGAGDLIGADVRFHRAILTATQNPLIGTLGALIQTALVGSFKMGWPSAATMSEVRLREHQVILDAILVHDGEAARARMTALLDVSMHDVRRALARNRPPQTPVAKPQRSSRP